MATTDPEKLFPPSLLPITATTLYTAPLNTETVIKHFILQNTSSLPVNVTVYKIDSGDTLEAKHQVFKRTIAGYDFEHVGSLLNSVMSAGDFIAALADTADVIAVHGSGSEITV